MTQNRTHTCGELRLADAGRPARLCGWLENLREVGASLGFAVLRDFYGTTQVVIETEDMMRTFRAISKESTVAVSGVVRERGSKNPKQATGDVELVPESVEVLGRCRYNALPFEINRSRDADETARLKYRYLRNPAVKQNIILRCNVVAALRKAMMEHDFLEITTPILTASSPEGARDYLVPARKHPGKFYALPQAPQQPYPQQPYAAPDYYGASGGYVPDAFINGLTPAERDEFTRLFISRVYGENRRLPVYRVGEDNREFFTKIFVFMGRYRNIISDGLLEKIYNYSNLVR